MPIEYRPVQQHEEPGAMRLWTQVFNVGEWLFQSNLDAEENRQLHQTLVAVDDGRIVSSVQYFIRKTRGADGSIHKMGGIGNVATYDDARKKGHSGKLLEMAIDYMAKDGCTWSLLFTGVNTHYERYGWKTLRTRYREGTLAPRKAVIDEWRVMPVNPASDRDSLERISTVYDAFNAKRPLTNVRTQDHWMLSVLPRMTQPNCVTYTSCLGDCRKASAYAVARTDDTTLFLNEIGCVPGCEESLLAVMDVVRELAVHRNVEKVRAHVPFDSTSNTALARLADNMETGFYGYAMARSLGHGLAFDDIQEMFLSEQAIIWPLDDF